jgi:hypothetical protein
MSNLSERSVVVNLGTADGCEGQFEVKKVDDGKLATSKISWRPDEPDKETVSVEITLRDAGRAIDSLHVEPDFWRELESAGLDDQLWEILLAGEDLREAVESMPVSSSRPRM